MDHDFFFFFTFPSVKELRDTLLHFDILECQGDLMTPNVPNLVSWFSSSFFWSDRRPVVDHATHLAPRSNAELLLVRDMEVFVLVLVYNGTWPCIARRGDCKTRRGCARERSTRTCICTSSNALSWEGGVARCDPAHDRHIRLSIAWTKGAPRKFHVSNGRGATI